VRCHGDPEGFRRHPLYLASDGGFTILALVWLHGQVTPVHDRIVPADEDG
jgi:3-mercaptopropionate dioxygenase